MYNLCRAVDFSIQVQTFNTILFKGKLMVIPNGANIKFNLLGIETKFKAVLAKIEGFALYFESPIMINGESYKWIYIDSLFSLESDN